MIKKIHNIMHGIDLSKRQLEKIADQIRLLSWALGAILTSSNGFHLRSNLGILALIVFLWLYLQFVAIIMDKRSERK